MTGRGPTTVFGAAGALGVGIAATTLEAPAPAGVAWAVLAAFALSLMLHGPGLRVLGVLVGLLSVLGGALAVASAPWLVVGFVATLLAAVMMVLRGTTWRVRRRQASMHRSMWEELDEGHDPTI
ncbi:hypothetical protein [uncultured Tessaracoccus sp.]|uniref:hypothetical protein n=1 Tax=uncultured Tessaracoccus sp. TaxID=905023 RepID=UPI0025E1A71A|nr:hypothetical protein [uncultured Tessaracoccus sp.]